MAESSLKNNIAALFEGMDTFVSSKTVVGEPMQVGGATIIPLMDVSCGMAAGAFAGAKEKNAGGMNAKISPAAVLVIQNGATRILNVRSQDAVSKVVDLVPDLINKFTATSKISPDAIEKAKEMVDEN